MINLLLRARDRNYVAAYFAFEPPDPPADRIDRAEGMVFVRDGFSWMAAFIPPVWLAARGAWLALAVYFAAAGALLFAFDAAGADPGWTGLALIALHVAIGFEAAALQRWSLERSGWTEAGAVSGRNLEDCERRFFDLWLAGQPVPGLSTGSPAGPAEVAAPGPWSMLRLFGRG